MLVRAIDVETTGIPDDDDPHAIVEVGYSDFILDEDRVESPIARLVNPERPIPAGASAVHHIIDADVVGGITKAEAIALLHEGSPDLFVAHQAEMEQAFFAAGDVPWLCTYRCALRIWPDERSHSLQALRYSLGLPVDRAVAAPPHRAGPDAYVCAHLARAILAHEEIPLDRMVRWSSGPPLMQRINFSVHRGKRWDEIPLDFLQWVANPEKNNLDADTRANARYWIKQRTTTP